MTEAQKIVRLDSEHAKAERFKARIPEALLPVLALINEAKAHGLLIEFHIGDDAYGRAIVECCHVVKRY